VKIYTKTGDAGETSLFGGMRVPKDDARVRAYGDVDELNAVLGFAMALEPSTFESAMLATTQRDLFTIGAELATPDPAKMGKALARSGSAISGSDVGALEDVIDNHESKLEPLKNFILPGKAAAFHVARTVCRRAERSVVTLSRTEQINPAIIHYLNRLSDLLFVLARAVNQQAGTPDVAW